MEEILILKECIMMNKFFIAVGQITVGVIVGNAAGEVMNKAIVAPLKKVLKAKKEEA
jgi:hypothetical protein